MDGARKNMDFSRKALLGRFHRAFGRPKAAAGSLARPARPRQALPGHFDHNKWMPIHRTGHEELGGLNLDKTAQILCGK